MLGFSPVFTAFSCFLETQKLEILRSDDDDNLQDFFGGNFLPPKKDCLPYQRQCSGVKRWTSLITQWCTFTLGGDDLMPVGGAGSLRVSHILAAHICCYHSISSSPGLSFHCFFVSLLPYKGLFFFLSADFLSSLARFRPPKQTAKYVVCPSGASALRNRTGTGVEPPPPLLRPAGPPEVATVPL